MSLSKKKALKYAAIGIMTVCLFVATLFYAVPQNQENRSQASSNGGSGSSTSQSATYWWSMFQMAATTERSGAAYSTPTAPSTIQTVPLTNQTLWAQSTVSGVGGCPAVGNGEVFAVTDTGALDAMNASTGTVVWSYNDAYVFSSPAYADGEVFVVSSNKTICALDASTGALLWSYPTGEVYNSGPTLADGVVYVGSEGGNAYALNATTGAQLWNYTTGGLIWSTPAVADGVVVLGMAGSTCALNASTGVLMWNCSLLSYSSPAVAGGVVYVSSVDDNVYALNYTTGAQLWNYTTGGPVESSPAVASGAVYVGSVVYVYSASGSIVSEPGNFYALNASTGALMWNYTTGYPVYSSPAVAGDVVYVGSLEQDFYAFNATNGALIWSYNNGGEGYSSPAVYNDVVFVGSNGCFYAFGQYPFSVSISPFSVEISVGQPQAFSSRVIGGTSPYTFQWYLDGVPVSGATDASWTFTPTSAGSYTVYLEVTDSLGNVATSTDASVSVTFPAVISILNPGPDSCPSAWNASDVAQYVGTPDFVFYSNETPLGSTFFVNVTVTNVTDLYAWGIGLVYDNTTLQFVNAWLPTDNVFSGATASGATLIPAPAVVDTLPFNSTYAIVKWGCTFLQGSSDWCFNGSGTLGQIEFRIIGSPNSTTPQITSTFTLDSDWTTTIYWPIIPYPQTCDERTPLLETGSFAYIS